MCCDYLSNSSNSCKIRLLIGICDIGNGHINRQRCIIDELMKCNVEIVLAVTKKSIIFFDSLYPDLKKVIIHIPRVYCDNQGIEFENTLRRYKKVGVDQYEKFLEFAIDVQKCFGGKIPDICMSDYEPNVAQFSYAINKPLISMEQQSKLLYMDSNPINGLTINEEIARLKYFFPKVTHRFISSFFPIEDFKDEKVTVLPPILKDIKRKISKKNKGIIYFSPYADDYEQFIKILDLAKKEENFTFYVYTNIEFKNYHGIDHIIFKKISDEFNEDISDCNFIISSSGHQLISEAIYLAIPVYIFTFHTFEQNYNARMVEKYKVGARINDFSLEEFHSFIKHIDLYKQNIKSFKEKYWGNTWTSVFMDNLEEKFGIHYIQ